MYQIGTGWLGWSPDVVWATPIPQIALALEAKVQFLSMTNPFGSKVGKKEPAQSKEQAKAKMALVALKRQELRMRKR